MTQMLEKLIAQNLELSADGFWNETLAGQIKASENKELPMLAACLSGRPDLLYTLIEEFDGDKHQTRFDGNEKIGLLDETLRAFIERKDIDRGVSGKIAFMDVIKILTRRTTKEDSVELSYNAFLMARFLANPELAKEKDTPFFDMVVDTHNRATPEKWDDPYNHLKLKYPKVVEEYEIKLRDDVNTLRRQMNAAVEDTIPDNKGFLSVGSIIAAATPKPREQ